MLIDGWFQDKANQRKQDLEDSLQAQQYFADANEAETWMREKEPIAANTDYGRDEDSAQVRLYARAVTVKYIVIGSVHLESKCLGKPIRASPHHQYCLLSSSSVGQIDNGMWFV